MNIVVLGSGAWGTAMAVHLNECGQRVTLLPRRLEQALELAGTRENKAYLPGIFLPNDLQIGYDVAPVLAECDILIFACPSKALRTTAEHIKKVMPAGTPIRLLLSLSKGLEAGTNFRAEQVLKDVFGDMPAGTISGPTNAMEISRHLPVAAVFATDADEALATQVQHAFSSPTFRLYRSSDIAGVELGGSLKNVYAIAAGICDGMRLGVNARASLLTRALAEMSRLVVALGGKAETVQGLSGLGDLVATASADWSRNRQFGIKIAMTGTAKALEEMQAGKSIVEGYYATKNFFAVAQKLCVPAPILECVHAIIFEKTDLESSIRSLMTRDLKPNEK
ncbi:MAG: NAD(P)-dependent glycerol-3-phosphate dehydrogenase [Opitutales bacterium]|nr:NAD(P)-dependent glycerol-3-phosphate dehydrogenase [Opitutales bacterium]